MPLLRVGVVLHQNGVDELQRLARSFGASSPVEGLRLDLHLLDNSPDRRLADPVGQLFSGASYRWMGANRGFGATHNVGMREAFRADADAYLCLNPDSVLHPGCLWALWATAGLPGTGLVDARTFPEEHPKPYDPESGETPWCTGTALLITRAAFATTGGFDEALFMYGEDVDLSWTVRAAGLRTRTAPAALVLHWVEYRPLDRSRRLHVLRSAAYLGRKWGAPAFARSYERLYRDLEGTHLEHPPILEVPAPMRSVADFRHGVRFARSRW
jgi:GT2 family glycosyltransferase